VEEIKSKHDAKLERFRHNITQGESPGLVIHGDVNFRFQNQLCMLNKEELERRILKEAHSNRYLALPGEKLYSDLR